MTEKYNDKLETTQQSITALIIVISCYQTKNWVDGLLSHPQRRDGCTQTRAVLVRLWRSKVSILHSVQNKSYLSPRRADILYILVIKLTSVFLKARGYAIVGICVISVVSASEDTTVGAITAATEPPALNHSNECAWMVFCGVHSWYH